MIQADKRRRFGKPVTLNDGVPETCPKRLRFGGQRGASRHHGEKSPAEAAADRAKAPPPAKKMDVSGSIEGVPKFFQFAAGLKIALDLAAQRLDQTGHCNESHDVLTANFTDHLCGVQRVHEVDRCAEYLRKKNSKKLAKDVAQRKQIEYADRMEETFIAAVMFEFGCNRRNVGENISVRKHNAARFGCRAGREDNLHGIVLSGGYRREIS